MRPSPAWPGRGPRLRDRYGETLRQYHERVPDCPRLERAFERAHVTPDLPIEERAENLLRHLGRQRATWTESDLQLEAQNLPFIDLTAVIEQWLRANPR